MMNKKLILSSFFYLSALTVSTFSFSAFSQADPKKMTPAEEAEIRLFMKNSGASNAGREFLMQILPDLVKAHPQAKPDFWKSFLREVNLEDFTNLLIPIYYKNISMEDLKAANVFYSSPAGKHLGEIIPKIGAEAAEQWAEMLNTQITTKLKAQPKTGATKPQQPK